VIEPAQLSQNILVVHIDHIVVSAASLKQGADYIDDILGVRPHAGGKHALMGTHNLLLDMGNRTYLEVIAIDPQAPNPGRPRWFSLDTLELSRPRLLTWVARTNSIDRYGSLNLGAVTKASRGGLEWLIAIPQDGRLHGDGLIPYLIQWDEVHATDTMPDSGCTLVELVGYHPDPGPIRASLASLGIRGVQIKRGEKARLEARIQTTCGIKTLR